MTFAHVFESVLQALPLLNFLAVSGLMRPLKGATPTSENSRPPIPLPLELAEITCYTAGLELSANGFFGIKR